MRRESLFLDAMSIIAEIVGLVALLLVVLISNLSTSGRFISEHYSGSFQFAFVLISLLSLTYFGESKIRRNEFVSSLCRLLNYLPFLLLLPFIIIYASLWFGNTMGWCFLPACAVAIAAFALTIVTDIVHKRNGYDKMVELMNKGDVHKAKKLNWLPLLAELIGFGLLCLAFSGPLFGLSSFIDLSIRPVYFYAAVVGTYLFIPFFIIRIQSRAEASLIARVISYLPPLSCLIFVAISLSQNLADAYRMYLPFFLALLFLSPICLITMLTIDLTRLFGHRKMKVAPI